MGDEEGIEDEELSEGLAKLLDKLGIRETAGPPLVDEALTSLEKVGECADTEEGLVKECVDMGLTQEDSEKLARAFFAEVRLNGIIGEIETLGAPAQALQTPHAVVAFIVLLIKPRVCLCVVLRACAAPFLSEEKLDAASKRVGVLAAAANEESGPTKQLLAEMEGAMTYAQIRQLFKISGLFYGHTAADYLSPNLKKYRDPKWVPGEEYNES